MNKYYVEEREDGWYVVSRSYEEVFGFSTEKEAASFCDHLNENDY